MTSDIPPQQPAPPPIEQVLHQAIVRHRAGELQEAEELYRAILQTHPAHPEANHNMGVLAAQTKQPAAGLPYFAAALEADQTRGQYWLSYIDALFQAGQPEAARQVLALARRQGLQGDAAEALAGRLQGGAPVAERPNADCRHKSAKKSVQRKKKSPGPQEMNTLAALFAEGRYAEAAALARTMTARYPLHGFGWMALGAALKQMGQGEAALAPMQKAAALSPGDADAHSNLGIALHGLGRLDEAAASYRRALEIKPDHAGTHNNLGVIFKELNRLGEAEASYRRALEIKPDFAEAHYNLGAALRGLGRLDEAGASYRRALEINPGYAEAHSNLGNILHGLNRLDEAEASYRRALEIRPDYAEAHSNLGVVLKEQGRLDEAGASYRRALEINPGYAEAHSNLGVIFKELNRLDEAEASYRRALEIRPDYAEAHANLGSVLRMQGRSSEAKACYRKARQSGFYGARVQEALMLPAIMGARPEMLESRAEFERNLDELIAEGIALDDPLKSVGETNFYLAYHGLNDRDLQVKAAKYYEQACPSLLYTAPHCIEPKADARKKIRVGFLSKFLYNHSVSLCFGKIIEILSLKTQFEATLISNHAIDEKVYSGFAGERVRLPDNLVRAREMLAALELDILVYLDIGMEPLSYFLAFSRLAGAQCVLGGHPVTTGIANVDYFLSAGLMEPSGADEHYSEKLVRLRGPMIYFMRPALPATLKTRHELNLPDGRRLYMCPMKLQKLHPDFDEAITRILQIDGNGAVVLFEDDKRPYWKKALAERFEKTIPAELRERIIFLPWLADPADFIGAIAAADVVLDPFHFGIGSTVATTAITGTPLVTKRGEFMRGRVGAGYCEMLGVPECIAEDTEGYARKAVEIASDQRLREKIRAEILKNNAVLYENPQPIEDFVEFLHSLTDGRRAA